MPNFKISTHFSTAIHFCPPGFGRISQVVREPDQRFLLVDRALFPLHCEQLQPLFPPNRILTVRGGERGKSLKNFLRIMDWLEQENCHRNDTLFVLGGGVLGDLGGWAAGTFKRGIPLILYPTTLMGMVDSALGGKAGVNHRGIKNLLGGFHPAQEIHCDLSLLATLPRRQWNNGWVEVVKYGLLYSQPFLNLLVREVDPTTPMAGERLKKVIEKCQRFKMRVVARDPLDRGVRRFLNLGHTLGHALEMEFNGTLCHGEAVAIGLAFMMHLSPPPSPEVQEIFHQVAELLGRLAGFRLSADEIWNRRQSILSRLAHDKKGGREGLKFIVLPTPLKPTILSLSPREVENGIERFLPSRYGQLVLKK